MSCPRRRPRHDQYFLPGYTLQQVLELHPTFNGEPNIAGYSEEILMDKIQLVKRLSRKLRDLVKCVNDEFYYMYIPNDARLAWVLLKAVCGICIKLSKNTQITFLPLKMHAKLLMLQKLCKKFELCWST